MIEEKAWTAIFTIREGDIRLISVRRAGDDELELHDREKEID